MNFEQNTGTTIQQAFDTYHRLNPAVYEEVKKLVFAALKRDKKKLSFKLIINVIRWEKFLQVEEPTLFNQNGTLVAFKINDAYSSRYARLFAQEFPEYVDHIEFRELRAK